MASHLFAITILYCDNIVQVKDSQSEDPLEEKLRRYLNISSKLPLEIQMKLSFTVFNIDKIIISKRMMDQGFRKIVKYFIKQDML